jgi:hypothetical protein
MAESRNREELRKLARSFPAAAVACAWLAPWIGAAIAVGDFELNQGSQAPALGLGLVAAGVAWVVAAALYAPMPRSDRINREDGERLKSRLDGLRKRQASLQGSAKEDDQRAACTEADAHLDACKALLQTVGFGWTSRSSYITAWERLHRAEEALIGAELEDDLLDDANHDQLRLKGSAIPRSPALLKMNDDAIRALKATTPDLDVGRRNVKEVRMAVNDYRDSTWDALVGLRNRTTKTLLLVELTGVASLSLALVGGVPSKALVAASAFFLVGALVGLFNHLYTLATAGDTSVDDYGLANARLLALPVYSGLAAVGGVLLSTFTGVHSGKAVGEALSTAFDVQQSPFTLVIAAVFGLAPGRLITGLNQKGQKLQSAIKSTEPTDGSESGQGGS